MNVERRIDEGAPEPMGGDRADGRLVRRSPASRAAPRRQARRTPCGGSVLSAAQQQRLEQPLVDRTLARDHVADRRDRRAATAAAPAADSRVAVVPGTRAAGSKIHHGRRPSLMRTVQRAVGGEIDEREVGRAGPCSSSRAPMLRDERRWSPDCPTARGDCRCRSPCRVRDRRTSGSARPPGWRPRAARRARRTCSTARRRRGRRARRR